MDVFPDNGTEFCASCIDEFSIDHVSVIGSVVPEIGYDGSGSEVHVTCYDTISGIREMAY